MERVSLDRSLDLYRSVAGAGSDPGPGMIEELGKGWIEEEALAISLFTTIRGESG